MAALVACFGPAGLGAIRAEAAEVRVQESADELYESGRRALNDGDHQRAADLMRAYRERAEDGRHAAASYYFEAFALSRTQSTGNLRTARRLLERHAERYPGAATSADAAGLLARVHGELAQRGDSESARWVYERTEDDEARRVRQDRGREAQTDEAKIAALQALMNMDSERALPILRRVVQNRDGNPELRAQAMFILSQHEGSDVTALMLDAARNDPDEEVRGQAIFWLSQVDSPETVDLLAEILNNPADRRLHEPALFALSQRSEARAGEILKEFARSSAADPELKANAIFWIAQHPSAENAAFLRGLWEQSRGSELRESILFSLSQMEEHGNTQWLMDIALDTTEDIDVRNQALYAASQRKDVRAADLVALYDRAPDRALKEQALFILSQKKDPAAFDKLADVARNETDRDLRQNAIFWIGQSGDPRAEDVLLGILDD